MSASLASVSIIIVNWNGGALVRRAVESIVNAPPRVPYEIVVVDNASSDGSIDEVKRAAGSAPLTILENATNVGFSRANNRAFAATRSSLVFLLNADAEVTPGAVDTLIGTLHEDARNGACGPRLVYPDGRLQPSAWRSTPTAWEMVVSGAGLWRLIPQPLRGRLLLGGHWDHRERRSVPMVFGTALLVRREVIETVGPLDERFYMYAEDQEWCLRMTRGGWRVIFEPAATVLHHGGHSAQERWTTEERLRVLLRSHFEFQRSSFSRRRLIINLAAGIGVSALQWGWRALRGRRTTEAAITFEMYAATIRQTLSGRDLTPSSPSSD